MLKNLIHKYYVEGEDIHSYIHQLIANKNIIELRKILRHQKLRNIVDIDFKESLFLRTACVNDDVKIVKLLLLDNKIRNNAKFKDNYSNDFQNPFIVSVLKGNLKTIVFFLNNEETNKIINLTEKGYLALNLAVWGNNLKIVKELFKKIQKIEEDQFIKLFSSIFNNLVEGKPDNNLLLFLIKEIEKRKINLFELEEEGKTVLDVAVELNNVLILEKILPYVIKNKSYVEQSLLYALKLKRFNSVDYLHLQKNIKINCSKDMFTNQEVKDYLHKLELYKYYMNNDNKEKGKVVKV